jgi:hypothetical protein
MARIYYINGQCLVKVRGSTSNATISNVNDITFAGAELGLTDNAGKVTMSFNYKHQDYKYDDWGDEAPPDIFWKLCDVDIDMTFVHVDQAVLRACLTESAGGGTEGKMQGAYKPLGLGKPMYDEKNHYISLFLSSPSQELPWRFKACVLTRNPVSWPISAERSLIRCHWRAIPYQPFPSVPSDELKAKDVVVWDHKNSLALEF